MFMQTMASWPPPRSIMAPKQQQLVLKSYSKNLLVIYTHALLSCKILTYYSMLIMERATYS